MIVFDTNVVSELMRTTPDETVLRWYEIHRPKGLYTTAITLAEIRLGIERLPNGRRKDKLNEGVREVFTKYVDAIVPFDGHAAVVYAEIAAGRERAGRPVDQSAAMIAAICRLVDATLATRNTKDFVDTGINLVNPWE
jgi:predicted nucleic acid-binding protein